METIKIERICKPGETNVNGLTYDLVSYNKALEKFKECLSCGYGIGVELFLNRHAYPEIIRKNFPFIDKTNSCGKIIDITDEYIVIEPKNEEILNELNKYISDDNIYAYMRFTGDILDKTVFIREIITFDIMCGRRFEFIEKTGE